jgi:pimeloyl-ACP methyl ester carboxylesterase
MGAFTTAALAAHYPDLVRGIVLEDPPWRAAGAVPPQEHAAHMAQWRQNIVAQKSQSQAEIMAMGRQRSPSWADEEFDAWAEAKLQVSPNVFQFGQNGLEGWTELVPRLVCPALLVTGDPERGAIVTPQVAAQVAARNERVRIAHIAGAGHNIRREQFDRYLAVVREFLAEVFA